MPCQVRVENTETPEPILVLGFGTDRFTAFCSVGEPTFFIDFTFFDARLRSLEHGGQEVLRLWMFLHPGHGPSTGLGDMSVKMSGIFTDMSLSTAAFH